MSATDAERRRLAFLITRVTVILVTVALVVALGAALHASQARSERQLAERFEARGELASSFAATWVEQLLDQQFRVAVDSLSGAPSQLEEGFASAVGVFDFPAAGLLDSNGRVLATHPRDPGLIGSDLAFRYRHLAKAVNGRPAVSSVVASASHSVPIVAFAVPYHTPSGRRVFSGSYELSRTPLGDYLAAVTAIPHSDVYVVDAVGTVVATSASGDGEGSRTLPAALAEARRQATDGDYTDASSRRQFFTSQPVAGTPWFLVMTAPHDKLFAPTRGRELTLQWMVLGLVALLAGGANWMFLRLLSGRDRLRALNAALDSSARTDQLTGLPNRRRLDESLTAALSAGGRHNLPVSVLVMDVDHFKKVNDTYGHTIGDRVLEQLAGVLEGTVRTEDMVGRWGGEEFLAVLPHTDDLGASRIAERLRQAVKKTPYISEAGGRSIVTTLSIGCATSLSGGSKDDLIHRADQALYRAKAAGRNSVRSAPSHIDMEAADRPSDLEVTHDRGPQR